MSSPLKTADVLLLALLGQLVLIGTARAAPISVPLPPGEGELPRLSALLWNHVGKNRALGQKSVTLSLTGRMQPGPHGSMRVSLIYHRDGVRMEPLARGTSGTAMAPLPDTAAGRAVTARLKSLSAPVIWWLDREGSESLFQTWSPVEPGVALGVTAWWHVDPAGEIPALAVELARKMTSAGPPQGPEQAFSRWAEEARRAGLTEIGCTLACSLAEPGYWLSIGWEASQDVSPRMRSRLSRNVAGKGPGEFEVTLEEGRDRVEARTFLAPYAVTVSGPAGEGRRAHRLLSEVLEAVFQRSAPAP
jgi:hypothetical protein